MKAFFTEKSYEVIHIETALLSLVNHHCELFGLLKSYIVLEKLQNLAQVLCLDFLIRDSSLDRREVKVVEDVLDLCDFIVFKRSRFLVMNAEVFVGSR